MNLPLELNAGEIVIGGTHIQYPDLGSFAIGQRTVIVGTNGSGKSVLARALAGTIPQVYDGRITVGGSVGAEKLFQERSQASHLKIMAVPQDLREFFLGLPVRSEFNISSNGPSTATTNSLLERLDLRQYQDRPLSTLSDGERRRLAVACSLSNGRPWLVFDEWPLHLDSQWQATIGSTIAEAVQSRCLGSIELLLASESDSPNHKSLASSIRRRDGMQDAGSRSTSVVWLKKLLDELKLSPPRSSPAYALFHNGTIRTGSFFRRVSSTRVPRGELLAVWGRNGTGKTTLLRKLRGNPRPRCPVFIFADPTVQLGSSSLFSMLRQSLPPRPQRLICRASVALARVLGVDVRCDPLALNWARKKVLAVLLAVVCEHPAVVIDEPFVGLDDVSLDIVLHAIKYARTGLHKAIVVTGSTHADREYSVQCGGQVLEI